MLILASAARCQHGRPRVFGSLSRGLAVVHMRLNTPSQSRTNWPSWRGSHSWAHHHDPRIEDIRNIGIIAHVDAGKTTTTERMLYKSGVTRHLGNVDQGDTVTDFLPLERQRGITIQSAAISFQWPLKEHCSPGTSPKTINLIDTPGHQDFRFEVDRCLPVLDGAVCIIDSVKGVEAHTERVWAGARHYKIPTMVYVNKLDRDGASFKKSVMDVASRLDAWPLVCQIPLWEKDEFVGVVDVIQRCGWRWSSKDRFSIIPENTLRGNALLWEEIETARAKLVEKLCEDDEALFEAFSDGSDLAPAAIRESVRRAIADPERRSVPVFAGSSLQNMGVEPLLNAVVDYLPSPDEKPGLEVLVGSTKNRLAALLQSAEKPPTKQKGVKSPHPPVGAVASIFKVVNDPSLQMARGGMTAYVRMYHGTLHKNSQVWNANLGISEKILNIMHVSASKVAEVPHLSTGQIGAVTGLKAARTGDTLHVLNSHGHKSPDAALKNMTIRPPEMAPPVAFISMEPHSQSQVRTLEDALDKLSREDPSLRWSKDERLDSFILSGMGKLHLEVNVDRLKTHYGIQALFGSIQVDYKECLIAPTGPHRCVYDKVVASKSGRAACTASLEPLEGHHRDSLLESSIEHDGNIFHIKIGLPENEAVRFDTELVRKQLFNGAYAAMARGPRRSSPMHSCHVTLMFDAREDFSGPGTDAHIVNAARNAVRNALKDAHAKNAVGILEPVMRVNIYCPEPTARDIAKDIGSRRGGRVLDTRDVNTASADRIINLSNVYAPPDPYEMRQSLRDPKKGLTRMLELVAKVPLKDALDYDDHLRSITGGKHALTMELDTFERVVGSREKDL